jgi:hypothetical protein
MPGRRMAPSCAAKNQPSGGARPAKRRARGRAKFRPPNACRQWVGRNLALLLDKNPTVRKGAARTLADLEAADPAFVGACLQSASDAEGAAFERLVTQGGAAGGGSRPGSCCTSPVAGHRGGGALSRSASARVDDGLLTGVVAAAAKSAPSAAAAEAVAVKGTAEEAPDGGWGLRRRSSITPASSAAVAAAVAGPPAASAAAAEAQQQAEAAKESAAPPAAAAEGQAPGAVGLSGCAEELLALLPAEPAAQARHLAVLVHRAALARGEAEAEAALAELRAAAGPGGAAAEAWEEAAEQVRSLVLVFAGVT